MVIWGLYIVLLCYNILDVYQTNLLFGFGAYEANPILSFFMRHPSDIQTIIIIKTIMFIFLGVLLCIYNKKEKKKYENLLFKS